MNTTIETDGFCAVCGSTKNVVRHHLSWEPETTMPVCKSCHNRIHRGDLVDYRPTAQPPQKERCRRNARYHHEMKLLDPEYYKKGWAARREAVLKLLREVPQSVKDERARKLRAWRHAKGISEHYSRRGCRY
jgi:hypothetical protein